MQPTFYWSFSASANNSRHVRTLLLPQAHPTPDPDKPRSTSPESRRERFTQDNGHFEKHQHYEDDHHPQPVLGSRVWEEMTKSKNEILVVDETSVAPDESDAMEREASENGPLVVEEETDRNDENATPRQSDASTNPLNRFTTWGSSVMISLIPGKRPAKEPPPPEDWEKPKPGYKHAETQTII
jgi:hypothetical protein